MTLVQLMKEKCSDRDRSLMRLGRHRLIDHRGRSMTDGGFLRLKVQVPLCRLPSDVRDKPVTSPLICLRRRRFPRFLDANGLVADLSRGFFKPSRHVAMV